MGSSDSGEALTSERLAEIESRVIEASYPRYDYPYSTDAKRDMSDLLAEVERLRAREAALVAVVEQVIRLADDGYDADDEAGWVTYVDLEPLAEQARALLASADGQEGGGDGA